MTQHKFGGMDKDTPFAQRSQDLYYDAHNIKLVNNGANKSVTKHEGFELYFTIPDITEVKDVISNTVSIHYTDPMTNISEKIPIFNSGVHNPNHTNLVIVGTTEVDDMLALITVSDEGMTFIFTYYDVVDDERYGLKLKYANYLNMKNDNKIELISNYENLAIKKLYWADGINQLRHLNLADSDIRELAPAMLDLVTPISFIEPELNTISEGAGQKGGKVQYAYSLYNLSGSETRISPLSRMIAIVDPETGEGGGEGLPLGEDETASGLQGEQIVNATIEMVIRKLDTAFNFIRIYAIKFTRADETPQIRLIIDSKIGSYKDYSFTDDGSLAIVLDITVEELLTKGGTVIVPSTIEAKSNKLFMANYSRKSLAIDFDARAYKYLPDTSATVVYDDNLRSSPLKVTPTEMPIEEHSCYNDDEFCNYKIKSYDFGASGKLVNLNVRLEDLEREVQDGTTVVPDFQSDNIYDTTLKWDANRNMLVDPDGVDVTPLGGGSIDLETEGSIYYIMAAGSQDINDTGNDVDYGKDEWLEVVNVEIAEDTYVLAYIQAGTKDIAKYKTVRIERSFKRGENYRFAVEFYNNVGDRSDAKWICDYRFPYTQDLKQTYTVSVSLTAAGIKELSSESMVKFRLLMVERGVRDRSIITQGIINPMMKVYGARSKAIDKYTRPYHTHRDYTNTKGARLSVDFDEDYDYTSYEDYWSYTGPERSNTLMNIFFPEVIFEENINDSTTFRVLGTATLDPDMSGTHDQQALEIKPNAPRVIHEGIYIPEDGNYINHNYNDSKDNKSGRFMGFNKVYGGLEIPNSRVYGNNDAPTGKSKPKKFLTDSDVEMVSSVAIIDSDRAKTINGVQVAASLNIYDYTGGGGFGSNARMSIQAITNSFGLLTFDDPSWSEIKGESKFYNFAKTKPTPERKALIGELIVELKAQYGGHTHSIRQRNVYTPIGPIRDILDTTIESKGEGDVWITLFKIVRNTSNPGKLMVRSYYLDEWLSVTLESALDLSTRYDYFDPNFDQLYLDNGVKPSPVDDYSPGEIRNLIPEMQLYNNAYHTMDKLFLNMSKPDSARDQERYPTTIIASKTKINNEKIDSWLAFDTINTMTLSTNYGEIRALSLSNDELIAFQRSAIAFISVDPRVQTMADDKLTIGLGVGKALNDYNYVTTSSGCINKWSILNTKDAMFYFDYDNRSISMLSQPEREVSVTTGINKHLWDYIDSNKQLGINTDKIGNEIIGHYDNRSENTYFTFNGGEQLTVSYNNLLNVMVSFHDFDASDYVTYKGEFLKINNGVVHKLAYDTYGENVDMRITVLNSEAAQLIKRYDNLEIDNSAAFECIRLRNSYQDTGRGPFKARTSGLRTRLALPRAANRKRLRDDHLYVELFYLGNEQITFEYLSLTYDIDKMYYIDG
ncbi:MAG: hypothetical protein KAH32_04490 [Chlamydiia bacterium]|nr:hypothetical protein [Chlamydiia bacterium]